MKKLVVVILLLLLYAMGTLVACTAGMAGIFGIASVEESVDTPAPATPGDQEKRAIPVTAVQILTGYGSPIPVVVDVSGDWPDLCAQLAEIGRPEVVENEIAISLLATAPTPGCPPDRVGLPFRLRIPLNWMALAEGAYTVNVNGQRTTLYVPVTPPDSDPEAESGGWAAPVVPDPRPVAATVPVAGRAPVAIAVEGVYVEGGVGSPIPVEVRVSGTWPSTCAFQPEVRQMQRSFHFEIALSADPGPADCPPDFVGLPFVINVPLNVVELPAGRYTVQANGASTAFEVPVPPLPAPATPVAEAATATPTLPAATAPPTRAGATPVGNNGACTNVATFVADVTIPDGSRFQPGSTFYKTWRVRNSGTCTWGQHYTLAFRGGDRLGVEADHYALAGPVAPGATVDVGVPLVAPPEAGPHTGSWELEASDGRRFGVGRNNSALTVVIVVESQTAIRGLVWQDQNGNNRRDDGEEMANANVLLFGHPDCSVQLGRTATTAVGGAYAFYDLAPGRYCVVITDASGALVQQPVQVAPGQEVAEVNLRWPIDAGDPGTIAGVIFRDANGNNSYDSGDEVVGGREVWLLRGHCDRQAPDARTTTGTDGRYTFKPLSPGDYCVSLRFPGGHEDAQSVFLGSGQVLSELHLRAHLGETTAAIGGLLWHDHCFLSPDGTWQGNCVDVDPARGRTANGVRDAGEEGIGGVTIRLLPGPCGTGNPTVLATAVTGADGAYAFSNLAVGTYCVSMNAAEPGNAEQLLPGDWTYPALGIWYHELTLSAAEKRMGLDFGWDYHFR